jgi:hypothetical protein
MTFEKPPDQRPGLELVDSTMDGEATPDCRAAVEGGDEQGFDLILDDAGQPSTKVERVRVLSVSAFKHTQYLPADIRAYGRLRVLRTGQDVLKVWGALCGGCRRLSGSVCGQPKLKPALSGTLRRDGGIALKRRLTSRDLASLSQIFVGKEFRVPIRPVVEDSQGNRLPSWEQYSVAGQFLFEGDETSEAGESLTSTLGETVTPTPTRTSTNTYTEVDVPSSRSASGDSSHGLQARRD